MSDAGARDAAAEAGKTPSPSKCASYDDLEVAFRGIHLNDFWVTRLRAFLPASALDRDLALAPAEQRAVSNVHSARSATNCAFAPNSARRGRFASCASSEIGPSKDDASSIALGLLTCGLIVATVRRRRSGRGC